MALSRIYSRQKDGFTIVELLVVIVVIAILAAITIVAYNGIQVKAQNAKMKTDISELTKAIITARTASNMTLMQIDGGNVASGYPCWAKPSGTNLATLPKTDSCWANYYYMLSQLSSITGINLNNMVDPWGRPYLIDENEGDTGSGSGQCLKDTVAAYTQPFVTDFNLNPATPINNIPLSGFTGCPT